MKRLLMSGNAIVRYVREDEPEDIPDYCSKVKLYLTDEFNTPLSSTTGVGF